MIRYRRTRDGARPFVAIFLAWEKADDGRIYYAFEKVSVIFLREVMNDRGTVAIRNFRKAIKAELAEKVEARIAFLEHDYDAIDLFDERFANQLRTYERMCEMLGVQPKERTVA